MQKCKKFGRYGGSKPVPANLYKLPTILPIRSLRVRCISRKRKKSQTTEMNIFLSKILSTEKYKKQSRPKPVISFYLVLALKILPAKWDI